MADKMTAEQALAAVEVALTEADSSICRHESTHRGGAIWEICDDCGAMWADDRGGKPKHLWPGKFDAAHQALATLRAELDGLRADAGRYRWLRENEWGSPIITLYAGDYENAQGDALDAAIDAAIQESSHEP